MRISVTNVHIFYLDAALSETILHVARSFVVAFSKQRVRPDHGPAWRRFQLDHLGENDAFPDNRNGHDIPSYNYIDRYLDRFYRCS